uniref:G-protein coupled receptors family 1 profile domain-containing protein n=1 Tax=Plectus sambesii TaxID=2011161 RepID=A0A914WR16_9BILA
MAWTEGGNDTTKMARDATVKTLFAFYGYMGASVLSLVVNSVVLVLSVARVRGDFVLFMANLAIADCLFSIIHMANTLCINGAAIGHRQLCRRLLDAMLPGFSLTVFALVPIALSRYILLCNRHLYGRLRIKKLAVLYCIMFDVIGIALTITAQHIKVSVPLTFILISLTVVASLAVVFLCDIGVFRKVSVLVKLALTMQHESRLRIAKQLAITTFLQALQPIIFQVPFVVFTLVHISIFPSLDLGALLELVLLGLAINPLLDGIITLLVVKKYRDGILSFSFAFLTPRSRLSLSRQDQNAAQCIPMVVVGGKFTIDADYYFC